MLRSLALDINGTLTCDGRLLPGVRASIKRLKQQLDVCLISCDSRGNARAIAKSLAVPLHVVAYHRRGEAFGKLAVLRRLGPSATAAIGNGESDRLMFEEAALSIAVLGKEGAAGTALMNAAVVVRDIADAFDLLLHPARLIATLRC
ncbi:MAG: hypothetical protein NTW28_11255 [Candidatus Solibacter sp.]|nr:hypothetical protein [Candidatus Solibacter sp.]